MPVLNRTPKAIQPFTISHRMELEPKSGGQYEGECPNPECGSVFRVSESTGQWDCKGCHSSGNLFTFIRWLHGIAKSKGSLLSEGNVETGIEEFAANRSIGDIETLNEWGIALSPITGEWMIPGYDLRGEIMNLYIYRSPGFSRDDGTRKKPILLSTANCEQQLFGMHLFDHRKSRAYICQSVWDAMVLRELLPHIRESDKGITFTASRNLSIASSCNVVAVPGDRVFKPEWCDLFAGKQVIILSHSDHPKRSLNGILAPPSGYFGMRKMVKMLAMSETPPESMQYLFWGDGGYDSDLPSGYDLRDWLTES